MWCGWIVDVYVVVGIVCWVVWYFGGCVVVIVDECVVYWGVECVVGCWCDCECVWVGVVCICVVCIWLWCVCVVWLVCVCGWCVVWFVGLGCVVGVGVIVDGWIVWCCGGDVVCDLCVVFLWEGGDECWCVCCVDLDDVCVCVVVGYVVWIGGNWLGGWLLVWGCVW